MKKYIVAGVIAVTLFVGISQAQAVTFDDLWREITNLKQQVIELKSQLGAAVSRAGIVLDSANTKINTITTQDILVPVSPVETRSTSVPGPSLETRMLPLNTNTSSSIYVLSGGACWETNQSGQYIKRVDGNKCPQQTAAPTTTMVPFVTTIQTAQSEVKTVTPVVMFDRNLAFGQRGDEVRKLQEILIARGYLASDSATGFYGVGTAAALQKFQSSVGIVSDGKAFGPKTQQAFGFAGLTKFTLSPSIAGLICPKFSTTPLITVLSPNGGEVYQAGQQVVVKWNTCNVPSTTVMKIVLIGDNGGFANVFAPNTGSATVTLPAIGTFPPNQYGNYYKFKIDAPSLSMPADTSDNFFAINANSTSTGALQTPTIITSQTTPPQYIATGPNGVTDATKIQYNFVSVGGPSVISELKFAPTNANTVTSVRVGSTVAPVVSGIAWIQGLNLQVPNGGSGLNVDVHISYGGVGIGGILSGTTTAVGLVYVKHSSGGITNIFTPTVHGPTMTLVGSKPIVTLIDSNDVLINGQVKIASVAVTADPKGSIGLNWFYLFVNSLNNVTIPMGNNNLILKESGVVVPVSNDVLYVPPAGNDSTIIIFPNTYVIPAGVTKTFDIYVVTGNVIGAPKTDELTTMMAAGKNLFTWTDIAGGGSYGALTGSQIYNYPINASVISN